MDEPQTRSTTVAFRLDADCDLLAKLDGRGKMRGVTGRRDLARYYDLLSDALAPLTFTDAELQLLLGLSAEETADHKLLWAAVAVTLHDRRGDHNVWADAFIDRLRRLSPAESCALLDALEQFRYRYSTGGHQPEALLRSLGLVNTTP